MLRAPAPPSAPQNTKPFFKRAETKPKKRNTSPNPLTLKLSIHHHHLLPPPLLQDSKDLTRFKEEQEQQAAQEDTMLLCSLKIRPQTTNSKSIFSFPPNSLLTQP
jgi:hypothetical protein